MTPRRVTRTTATESMSMASVEFEIIPAVAGALGVGSLVGQYVGGGVQRRELRAAALHALNECELRRWVDQLPPPDFSGASRQLDAAGLVARLPVQVLNHYRWLSWAAFWLSQHDFDRATPDDRAGSIP